MTFSSHEFVIIDHHRKSLGRVLPDKGFDDTESFARPRCTDHPCTPETIRYIRPAFAEFALVIVPHGDIHAVFVLYFLLALFKTFILEIEAVFHQSFLKELRDVVEGDMQKDNSCEGSRHIENDVQR